MNRADLLELYERLYLIREAERAIVRHYGEDEMRTPMHMSMGQEVPAVAVCHALRDDDLIFGYYRSHALYLARTGDVEKFFLELYGKAGGACEGRGGSMHLAVPERGLMFTSAVVGGSIPAALGAAYAQKRRGRGGIAVAFFGEGAVDQGVFWESLNAACAMRLPVLFVCEDNGLAVHSPARVRCGYLKLLAALAGFECRAHEIDDRRGVEAVREMVAQEIDATRRGTPCVICIDCYRHLEHIGIEGHTDETIRPAAEVAARIARDPLATLRGKIADGSAGELDGLEGKVRDRVFAAVAAAKAAAFPPASDLLAGVYAKGKT